jgi:phosphate transport system substrate-binding protein
VALLLVACQPKSVAPFSTPAPTPLVGRVTFAGSTTVQPLAHLLGEAFHHRHPGVVLDIDAGGSSVGIRAIHDGAVDIGMASRQLRPAEAEGIEQHQIAVDVIAIVVHAAVSVEGLTKDQLRGIYLGQITNWREVDGPDQQIAVTVRGNNSGTRGAFDEIVLDNQQPAADSLMRAPTAGDMAAIVARTPGAIGYVGFGNIDDDLHVLTIDGIMPSVESAQDGSYTLIRPLLLLTGPLTQPAAHMYVEMALSDEGQKLIADSSWVPAR